MKKLITLITAILLITSVQAQKIKIFDAIIPKVVTPPPAMEKEYVLAIWDTLKFYSSTTDFRDAHPKGLYPMSDVNKVFDRAYEIVNKDLTPFMSGTAVKVEASIDNTDPDNPIAIKAVYWPNSTPEDKTAWRVYWRNLPYNKTNEVPLDIVPIWNAHRLYK